MFVGKQPGREIRAMIDNDVVREVARVWVDNGGDTEELSWSYAKLRDGIEKEIQRRDDREPLCSGVDLNERIQETDKNEITLRDYFAAKAMQGFAAHSNTCAWINLDKMAYEAYRWADVMLAVRDKAGSVR